MNNLEEFKDYDAFHLNLALYYAAMDGNKDVVKYILTELKKDKESVNAALENACSHNQLGLVKYLLSSNELSNKADVNFDIDKHNSFLMACEGGIETVKFLFPLLKFNNNKSKKYVARNSIIKACIHGNLDVLKYLLSEKDIIKHVNLEKEFSGLLNDAGSKENIEVFEYIFNLDNYKEKFLKNNDGTLEDIILTCLIEGRFEMVEYLMRHDELKNNIDINRDEDYIFKFICENEGHEVIQYLVVDLNIKKTEEIAKLLENSIYNKYKKMFETRELNNSLNNELDTSNQIKKKTKL